MDFSEKAPLEREPFIVRLFIWLRSLGDLVETIEIEGIVRMVNEKMQLQQDIEHHHIIHKEK